MDRISSRAGTQMVLEEDVNISDNKPDASYLLTNKGEIIMEEIRAGENVVHLRGKLVASVLYLTDMEGMCASMEAAIPFEEKVNMEGVNNGDTILTDWTIEDLTVGLINSAITWRQRSSRHTSIRQRSRKRIRRWISIMMNRLNIASALIQSYSLCCRRKIFSG